MPRGRRWHSRCGCASRPVLVGKENGLTTALRDGGLRVEEQVWRFPEELFTDSPTPAAKTDGNHRVHGDQ